MVDEQKLSVEMRRHIAEQSQANLTIEGMHPDPLASKATEHWINGNLSNEECIAIFKKDATNQAEYNLTDLLDDITPENRQPEVHFGFPGGVEDLPQKRTKDQSE